jgi:hypothetical protein
VNREVAGKVANYDQHVALTDRLGFVVADVFWGGRNAKPNVEAKGSCATVIATILRANFEQWPSRIDVKRDATQAGLFRRLRDLASVYADKHGLQLRDIVNNDPDKGDTFYLGARTSQACIRVYQPGLKRAQEEGRTGDAITEAELNAVRIELEFKPHKKPAKAVAATLSPDQLWGVSPWIAEFASEVFAMNVQPISISDRRESNRNRALRYMATQYRGHLADLLGECQGDVALFGSTILDLADIPYRQ